MPGFRSRIEFLSSVPSGGLEKSQQRSGEEIGKEGSGTVPHFWKTLPTQVEVIKAKQDWGAKTQRNIPFPRYPAGRRAVGWGREAAQGSHFRSRVLRSPHPHAFLQAAAELLIHLHSWVRRPTCGQWGEHRGIMASGYKRPSGVFFLPLK